MAGLLDAGDGTDTGDIPPDLLLMATQAAPAGSDGATTAAPADGAAAAAALPDSGGDSGGPGLFERIGRGIASAGEVLGGGDPGLATLTPEQHRAMGLRSLLNFSLSMLANSGPSYTPRNFGQILAAGLGSAGATAEDYETRIQQQQTAGAQLALKRAGLQIQALSAQKQLEMLRMLRDRIAGGQAAVAAAAGAPGAAVGAGSQGAPPASLTPYVAPNLPDGVSPAEDQAVRTVIGEAGGKSPDGQAAVAHVINNRVNAGGGDASSVIFAPNQFESWNNPATRTKLEAIDPTSAQYKKVLGIVRDANAGNSADPTGGATMFLNPALQKSLGRDIPAWATGTPVATIGNHQFFSGYQPPARAPGGGTAFAGAGVPVPGGNGLVTKPDGTTGTPGGGGLAMQPSAPGAQQPAANAGPTPDNPDEAAARARIQASYRAQLQSLASNPSPDNATKVQALQQQLNNDLNSLDQRKMDRIEKINAEQRALQQKQAEADYKFKLDQAAADAQQRRELEKTSAGVQTASDTEQLKKMGDAAATARVLGQNLSQVRAVLPDLPEGGLLYQQFPELAGILANAGIDVKGSTAVQLLQGMTANLATQLRPAGTGRLTAIEMQNFQRSLPTLAETPEGRQKALAFLESSARRIGQEFDYAQAYRKRNGDLIGLPVAMDAAREQGGLGPMIPSAPALNAGAEAHKAFLGGLNPGEPYYGWAQDPKTKTPALSLMVK